MKNWIILITIVFIVMVTSAYGSNGSQIWLATGSTPAEEVADATSSDGATQAVPEEVAKLIIQLDHPSKMMQYAAAQELGQLGESAGAAVPKLRQKIFDFLSNPDAKYEDLATARAAAQSLGQIGIRDPKTIELLQSLAKWAENTDPQMLRVSTEALEALKM